MSQQMGKIMELSYHLGETFFSDFGNIFDLPDKLTSTQIKAMIFIDMFDNCTMSDISTRLSIEKGSFTPIAKKLISLNYIERIRSEEDRRVSYLKLTDKGVKFVNYLTETLSKSLDEKMSVLDDIEQQLFYNAIEIIINYTKKVKKSL